MTPNSFQWGEFNSVDDWGIKIIKYDPLRPEKKDNRVAIPFNSIKYKPTDEPVYEDRLIPVLCVMTRKISRYDLRFIVDELDQKRELSFWDEPELHYVAEIYESADLETWLAEAGRRFALNFIAEPFAYSAKKTVAIQSGLNDVLYKGTKPAPCVIELINNTPYTAYGVQITVIKKED